MTDFYDIDRANARLPEVRGVLEQLRSQRLELIALRDRLVAARRHAQAPAEGRTLVDEALGRAAGSEPAATPVKLNTCAGSTPGFGFGFPQQI